MSTNVPTSYFETSDLTLAAVLQLKGFSIVETQWKSPDRCTFMFPETEELKATIELFWRHELRVEPHAWFASVKTLKSRIYSS